MAEREAVTRLKVEGADQAAGDIKKVADAQREQTEAAKQQAGVTGPPPAQTEALDKTAEATDRGARATDKLAASEQDLKDALDQVHPSLGRLVDLLPALSRLANVAASQNINLASSIGSITGAIKANAAAYALIGAGSAALGGILLARKAWKDHKAEIQEATQAIEKFAEAQSKLRGVQEDLRQQAIGELAGQGKLSPETLKQTETRARTAQALGFEDVGVQAAAATAGQEVDRDTLIAMAAAMKSGLIQPGGEDPMGQLARLRKEAESARILQDTASVITAEPGRKAEMALREIESFGVSQDFAGFGRKRITDTGPRTHARELIEALSGRSGQEVDERFDLMQKGIGREEGAGGFGLGDESRDAKLAEAMQLLRQIRTMVEHRDSQPSNVTITRPVIYQNRHGPRNVRNRRCERDLAGVG